MLRLIEEACTDVLVLTEGVEPAELARSRITQVEVRRQLILVARTLDSFPQALQAALPELAWADWRAAAQALAGTDEQRAEALWYATRSLVPATLSWLRVYRKEQPELFDFTV